MTYVIGWLIFGNIADNAFDPKIYLVWVTTIIGLYYIGLGAYLDLAKGSVEDLDHVIIATKQPIMVLYAGITAMSLV